MAGLESYQNRKLRLDEAAKNIGELGCIYSSEETVDFVLKEPWLIEFLKAIYVSDAGYYNDLILNPGEIRSLFAWLIKHPGHRDVFLNDPLLLKKLVDSGYDESLLAPTMKITSPLPYSTIIGSATLSIMSNPLHPLMDMSATWNHSVQRGEIDYWQNPPANISTIWDTADKVAGTYTITVQARAENGTILSDFVNIMVYPELRMEVEIVSPRNGQILSGNTVVSARVKSTLKTGSCKAVFSGKDAARSFYLTDTDNGGYYSGTVDTTLMRDGPYDLTITAYASNAMNASTIAVHVDNMPNVDLISPSDQAFIQGSLIIEANITSVHPLKSVVAYVDSEPHTMLPKTGSNSIYIVTLDSTVLSETQHLIYVTAVNMRGLSNTTIPHTVKIDNFPSRIAIVTPTNNTFITEQMLTIRVAVNDFANLTRLYVNGVPQGYQTHGCTYVETVEFKIDVSKMIFNTLIITAEYESALGHTSLTSHTITKQMQK